MEPIRKTNADAANQIIDPYLDAVPVPAPYKPRALYQGFSSSFGRNTLIDNILLPEQRYHCCYCMRDMHNHLDGTIEHIIPESADIATTNRYLSAGIEGLDSNNICHTSEFMSGVKFRPQYPHEVSYHNFAMACLKCNNERRRDKQFTPPFLVPTIKNEVRYNRFTGKTVWMNDDLLDPTIEKLELNEPLLKAIRAVWIFGKDHPTASYSTPDTVTNDADKADLIYRTFGSALSADSKTDLDIYLSLLTPHFWKELLRYGYFATI